MAALTFLAHLLYLPVVFAFGFIAGYKFKEKKSENLNLKENKWKTENKKQ